MRLSAALDQGECSAPEGVEVVAISLHPGASLLISLGAHPKVIQERLGHSDISVTLNLYGHLFPSLEEQLTDALDDLGRGAGSGDTISHCDNAEGRDRSEDVREDEERR